MTKRGSRNAIGTTLLLLQTLSSITAFTLPLQRSSTFIINQYDIRRRMNDTGSKVTTPSDSQQFRIHTKSRGTRHNYHNGELHMMLPADQSIATMVQQSSLHISSMATPALAVSPAIAEAEILKDVSHVLWDVVPFLGVPTLMFRLSILLGRILSMESDYIKDKVFMTDDLFFDVPLLGLSIFLVWRSLFPIIKAALSAQPSALDKIAFEQLFEPVGINWIQFRVMLATCLDWVSLEPGQVLEGETEEIMEHSGFQNATSEKAYLYWLYEGDVTGHYEGNFLTNIERHDGKSINDPSAVGLLADMKFLYNLDLKQKMRIQSDVEVVKYPMATFRVGKRGATLMRIEADQLYDLMEHDEHLEASIRGLLLKSLQRKVGLLLRSKAEATQSEKSIVLEEYGEDVGFPHELSM